LSFNSKLAGDAMGVDDRNLDVAWLVTVANHAERSVPWSQRMKQRIVRFAA
jgi:hypothetical protein